MNTPSRKIGRPIAIYQCADGTPVVGLMRLRDGRWRASGPEKFTYTEPDERLAVARFQHWQQARTARLGTVAMHDSVEAAIADTQARHGAAEHLTTTLIIDPSGGMVLHDNSLSPEQWAWLRQQILTRPRWVAERVGIEQLGYLDSLPKPTPSPTLEEVGRLYLEHAKVSDNWKAKCALFWREFTDAVAVKTLS